MSIKQVLFVAVVAAAVYLAFHLAIGLGVFQRVYNHAPGSCAVLGSADVGSDDVHVLPNGLAFISSGFAAKQEVPGRIRLFNFSRPGAPPKELRIVADQNFRLTSVAGISSWTHPKTGVVYVYVTSHQPQMNVDKFRFDPSALTLTHLRRINDLEFVRLGDIAVIGEDQFYFANLHQSLSQTELKLEFHLGNLGYFGGSGAALVDKAMALPTGIAVSRDKKFLFVAQCGGQEIKVYRKGADNSVKFSHAIKVNTCADQLYVDWKTGDLLAGAHPSLFGALQYATSLSTTAPSQVLRIKLNANAEAVKIEEIYANDGTEVSASSVAVAYDNLLLIGSRKSRLLLCEIR